MKVLTPHGTSSESIAMRRIGAVMIFVAVTLAVASLLHLSGNVHGSDPFDADHAGMAEAIIGVVLASAAIVMFRAPLEPEKSGLPRLGPRSSASSSDCNSPYEAATSLTSPTTSPSCPCSSES